MQQAVAVLGCGPAGMMAAQAVSIAGVPIAIFSEKSQPSRLGGAQFLHQPIPGINNEDEPDTIITYQVHGDEETYRRKVYGDDPNVPFTSFSGVKDGDQQPAWNLQRTYGMLWDKFGSKVNEEKLTPSLVESMTKEYIAVFSSIPLPAICRARAGLIPEFHHFSAQKINVCTRQFSNDVPPDTIVYDGTMDHGWYRASHLFGHHGTEWSSLIPMPPVGDIIKDSKPIRTDCNCHPDVTRVGRRGTWTKGVLTHHAFLTAAKAMLP